MHLLVKVCCREWDFVTHRISFFIGEYYHLLERIYPVDPAFSCNCTVEICKLIMGHLDSVSNGLAIEGLELEIRHT